jgi:DNA-binding IclR family transcriptional regulator
VELTSSKPSASGAFPQNATASQTLGRGLDVLEQVAAGPLALNAIAARLGLSRTTVHRLATSLLERRYLNLAPRRGYSLGPKLLELGSMARGQIGLVRTARPIMERLAEATGDAVLLTVRDGDTAAVADWVPGTRRLAPRLRVGERHDLVKRASGRALLVWDSAAEQMAVWGRLAGGDAARFLGSLSDASACGYVVDEAGTDPEIAMLAAPVRGSDGTVRAALSVAMAATYTQTGLAPAARDKVLLAASVLSQELGWQITDRHDASPETDAERELLNKPRAAAFRADHRGHGGAGRTGTPVKGGAADEGDAVKGRDA